MRLAWLGFVCGAFLACGGGSFSAGGAAGDGGGGGTKGGDGATEAGTRAGLRCGADNVCDGATPVCCYASDTTSFSCAHQECGCDTQLGCRQKSDCAGNDVCCIARTTDATCTDGHFVAACSGIVDCKPPSRVLCDPAAVGACGAGLTCKTDATTLASVGLPANEGLGVCGF